MPNVRMLKPFAHRISPVSTREWPGSGTFAMPDDIATAAIAAGAAELIVEAAPVPVFTPLQATVLASAADAIIAQAAEIQQPAIQEPVMSEPVADAAPAADEPPAERRRRTPRAR